MENAKKMVGETLVVFPQPVDEWHLMSTTGRIQTVSSENTPFLDWPKS